MQGAASEQTLLCSAQARPAPLDPPLQHPSATSALLSALFSCGHCRAAPRAPSTSWFPISWLLSPLAVFVPRCWGSLSSSSQGGCCVPVFGFLSSDPDGPRGPVTPQWCLCSLTMQMAELGFAGTARCIFQFIFLYLFPGTHFSSFPQGWCVGITVPCFCAFPDLVKNSFSLKESFSKLTQIMNY